MKQFTQDKLEIKIFQNREEMGKAAAEDAARVIKRLLQEKERLNVIFAAAPSQNEFLSALTKQDIDFSRITAFHMDEYIGLPKDAPQGFGNFLRRSIFEKCPFAQIHYLNGQAEDPEEECRRYTELLRHAEVDIVFLGIGENGHIAFNDPSVADFKDPKAVKTVALEEACRRQQVNDGCFASLEEVPKTAMTLTIPTLMKTGFRFCMVPSALKAQAVRDTVNGPVDEKCPASILRTEGNSFLYLETESAQLL